MVSIHAPAWGATSSQPCNRWRFVPFQSTRPRGARRRTFSTGPRGSSCFNPRARVGRDSLVRSMLACMRCFNPRARVGRDDFFCRDGIFWLEVSIHAPAWGATTMASFLAGSASVSIHAPAWGATLTRPPVLPVSSLFQSTRPRGARRQTLAFGKVASAVSIHAPAWGATFRYVFPLCNLGQFQSTRPRGARREIGGAFQGAPGFNPRARVGRDATRTGERPVLVWFQSTRPRGARRS